MAVVFDPHENLPGNIITGLTVPVTGTKYRMLIPSCGPFYTHSLVVKSGNTELKLGNDYLITHPYLTAMSRTGRSVHGMIWVVNPKFTDGFTVSCNALGMGIATSAQITAERTANANKYPSDCQWEQVIGDAYFPPVDIQFDWENWKGERELMQAIVEIGKKITEVPPIPDPIVNNSYGFSGYESNYTRNEVVYQNNASWLFKKKPASPFYIVQGNNNRLKDYKVVMTLNLPSMATASTLSDFALSLRNFWGSGFASIRLVYKDEKLQAMLRSSPKNGTATETPFAASAAVGKSIFAKPFKVTVVNSWTKDTLAIKVEQDGAVLLNTTIDFANPPAVLSAVWASDDIASRLSKQRTDIRYQFSAGVNDTFSFQEIPGASMETPDGSDVLSLLKKYHSLVDKLYREAPAHPHILRKDNPHGDQSYGRMRAIELNGIADDSTLVYGKSQAQLADYVNQRSAKATDFSDKMFRKGASPRTITGTFTMLPGLSAITSAKTKEADGVGTNLQVDDKVVRLIARDSSTINAGSQPITFNAGANQLILYPDARELQWNGKKILDPTTVGPYLPGNEGGGSGVFYATSTATVSAQGSGIQSMPFIFTWLPPDDTDPASLAMRQLATDFGTSDSLAATPALIQKLANEFTGKLEMAKAYINDLPLTSSVSLDKVSFGLDNVENTADTSMPLSNPQRQELAKYADVGHTHDASAFGIGDATTAKAGLVKFGGLVNDATLALDGQYVVPQFDTVAALERTVGKSDTEAVIDILRYAGSGNAEIANAGTFNGWMVVLKPNTYFAKKNYTVPTATFNLSELFPSAHEDTVIGVYVDLVGETAQYVLKDSIDFAESETLTRIGEIYTDEIAVTSLIVRNTTRLGNFREMEEHEENVNAHIPRTMTQAQFGYTFTEDGPVWNNGCPGARRFDGDYRMYKGDADVAMENVDWKGANNLIFRKTAAGVVNHRSMIHQCPVQKTGVVTMKLTSAEPQAASVWEIILASYLDAKGKRNRISLLVQRTNNITGSDGLLCYLGFAINYGTNRQVLIGVNASSFTTAVEWPALQATATPKLDRAADGAAQLTGELNLGPFGFMYSFVPATKQLTFWRTYGAPAVTETYDLTSYLSAAQIDISPLLDATWPVSIGTGMTPAAEMSVSLQYDMANFTPRPGYETAFDYIQSLSEMNRVRVISEPSTSKLSNADVRTAAAAKNLADAPRRPAKNPDYLNKDRLATYSDGEKYTAVVVRD